MTPLTNEISLIEWQTDAQHCLSVAQPGGRVRVIGSSLWRPVTAGRWRETRYAMDQPKAGLTIESHNTFSVGGYLAARSIWEFVVVHEQQPLINIIVFAYDVFLPFQRKQQAINNWLTRTARLSSLGSHSNEKNVTGKL